MPEDIGIVSTAQKIVLKEPSQPKQASAEADKPSLESVQAKLQRLYNPKKTEGKAGEVETSKKLSPFQEAMCTWTDALYNYYALGTISRDEVEVLLKNINQSLPNLILQETAAGKKIDSAEVEHVVQEITMRRPNLPTEDLPPSADAFNLYNPASGRTRLITSFNDQLAQKIASFASNELSAFISDNDPKHLSEIAKITEFAADARVLYTEFSFYQDSRMKDLSDRLKYLGLNKNLIVEGEESDLITAIVKSRDFGRLTPEDRGRKITDRPEALKNKLKVGKEPQLTALNTAIEDEKGNVIEPIHDENKLFPLVKDLTGDFDLNEIRAKYKDDDNMQEMISWTARQAIVRKLLPKDAQIPNREMQGELTKRLKRVKSLGGEKSSESFQASNPISLWMDPETNRKFIVKECPDATLQADYFGLEMLQLCGVPIYEFYYGWIPKDDGTQKRVLISGFLEGFKDPSQLMQLPEDSPKGMAKARMPEKYHSNAQLQRAMLMEILIGEYNTKAHNVMVLGSSVQHLDQGACLTSTASGKFKGMSEHMTITDVADVLQCFTDWDWDRSEPVNEAYARVAQVENGKLVIKDADMAKQLLNQMKRLPQEKIEEALVRSGYKDGSESIARMQKWMIDIKDKIMPKYLEKKKEETSKNGKATARTEQYLRWSESAIATFQKAIEMGGELAYYKYALRQRRADLETMWQRAIDVSENRK